MHEDITKDLTEKFYTFPIHDRIQPHITLKRWFDLDGKGMDASYEKLEHFANSHSRSSYLLRGFASFGPDVIYMDVKPSPEMSRDTLELVQELHQIKDMSFDEFDNGGNFHATVAMGALKPFDHNQIWNYLQTLATPDMKMEFDNIAVLKREKNSWVVDRVWELR